MKLVTTVFIFHLCMQNLTTKGGNVEGQSSQVKVNPFVEGGLRQCTTKKVIQRLFSAEGGFQMVIKKVVQWLVRNDLACDKNKVKL